MSNEEQDAILGRTAKDYAAAKRELAANLAAVTSHAKSLLLVSRYLEPERTPYGRDESPLAHGAAPNAETARAISELPTAESLQGLIAEIQRVAEEKRRLYQILEGAGVEPKA